MSTAGRFTESAPDASDVAARLETAAFVHLAGAATGDGLAATAQLARALEAAGVPFQARLAPLGTDTAAHTDGAADLTVGLARPDVEADLALGAGGAASAEAYAVATALDAADPVLGLAGSVAAGAPTAAGLREDAEAAGLSPRPGVAVPTADLPDGLAHATLVHLPVSGDADAAADALAGLDVPEDPDEAAHRRVASFVALTVAREGPPAAAEAVERALRPHAGGPLATVGGYADVLDAAARTRPGLGLAAALGGDADDLLPVWRTHGARAHGAVAGADPARYDGVVVATLGEGVPLGTVARLLRDFRSPEPAVAAVGDGEAVLTARDDTDVAALAREATAAVGGRVAGAGDRVRVRFEGAAVEFADALGEAR